jgi:CheY-like chemotaxis protein
VPAPAPPFDESDITISSFSGAPRTRKARHVSSAAHEGPHRRGRREESRGSSPASSPRRTSSPTCASAASTPCARPSVAYDVILLDWMLPEIDGLAVCRELRRLGSVTPIIMLTARGELHERVLGLEGGADDYLVKPFEIDELLARIHAILRRTHGFGRMQCGPLEIDRLQRRVTLAGGPLELTAREFTLLLFLARQADQVVARSELLSPGVVDPVRDRLQPRRRAHQPPARQARRPRVDDRHRPRQGLPPAPPAAAMSLRARYVLAISAITLFTLGAAFVAVSLSMSTPARSASSTARSARGPRGGRRGRALGGDELAISARPGPAANDVGPLTKFAALYGPTAATSSRRPRRGAASPPPLAELPAQATPASTCGPPRSTCAARTSSSPRTPGAPAARRAAQRPRRRRADPRPRDGHRVRHRRAVDRAGGDRRGLAADPRPPARSSRSPGASRPATSRPASTCAAATPRSSSSRRTSTR